MINFFVMSLPILASLFWAILLLAEWRKTRSASKAVLAGFMVVTSILYGGHLIFFGHLFRVMPLGDTLYSAANLAVYPLYYIYILSVTESVWRPRRFAALMLPPVIGGLVAGTLYLLMDARQTQDFFDTYLYGNRYGSLSGTAAVQAYVHTVFKFVFALQILFILVAGIGKIRWFDRLVEDNYSDTSLRKMYMAKSILTLFVVVSVVSFVANILGRQRFGESPSMLAIPSSLFSSLLFLLGYAGHRQNFTMAELRRDMREDATPQEVEEALPSESDEKVNRRVEEVKAQLTALMNKEQLFLVRDLKLNDVARHLGTNRLYVYRAINEMTGLSFSDYINNFRIDYAVRKMEEDDSLTVFDLCTISGFSSKTSFHRNFRRCKNCTPLQYKRGFRGEP